MSPSHNARVPSTPFPATMEDSDEALMLRYAAGDLGATDLPAPVKVLMQAMAKVMTTTAYRI